MERRVETSVSARLEAPAQNAVVEPVEIVNISVHGARVVTGSPCSVNEPVIITNLMGAFRMKARVVYCEGLTDGRCAIGLQFCE
ncbi:MAG TPA: PilZ domain-containing protein [Steroidobacteraceae bacterium]|nr:PilZ domain-containing protein [Steroidobacteraceae bacterium]